MPHPIPNPKKHEVFNRVAHATICQNMYTNQADAFLLHLLLQLFSQPFSLVFGSPICEEAVDRPKMFRPRSIEDGIERHLWNWSHQLLPNWAELFSMKNLLKYEKKHLIKNSIFVYNIFSSTSLFQAEYKPMVFAPRLWFKQP